MIHRHASSPGMAEVFLNLGPGPIADREAALAACRIDAAADRQWLLRHPSKKRRIRPPSSRERKAFALPAGSTVAVLRLPGGAQARVFLVPRIAPVDFTNGVTRAATPQLATKSI